MATGQWWMRRRRMPCSMDRALMRWVALGLVLVGSIGAAPAMAQQSAALPAALPTKPGTFEPAAELEVVRSLAEAKKAVAEEAVSFYSKRFKVSAGEARTRLGRQVMVSNLPDRLKDAQPTDLWFDNAVGRWVVAAQEKRRAHVASRLAGLGLEADAQVQVVEASASDLRTAADVLTAEAGDAPVIVGTIKGELRVRVSDGASTADHAAIDAAVARARSHVDGRVRHHPTAGRREVAEHPASLRLCLPVL